MKWKAAGKKNVITLTLICLHHSKKGKMAWVHCSCSCSSKGRMYIYNAPKSRSVFPQFSCQDWNSFSSSSGFKWKLNATRSDEVTRMRGSQSEADVAMKEKVMHKLLICTERCLWASAHPSSLCSIFAAKKNAQRVVCSPAIWRKPPCKGNCSCKMLSTDL